MVRPVTREQHVFKYKAAGRPLANLRMHVLQSATTNGQQLLCMSHGCGHNTKSSVCKSPAHPHPPVCLPAELLTWRAAAA
jgi:hypothetical protein